MVTEHNFVSKLLFGFFGQQPAWTNVDENDRSADKLEKIEELRRIMKIIYEAIRYRQFDMSSTRYLTADLVGEYFKKGRFDQFKHYFRDERVPYAAGASHKLRPVLIGICELALGVVRERSPVFPYMVAVREKAGIDPSHRIAAQQFETFEEILSELNKVETRPDGALSFDDDGNVIIRTTRNQFFPGMAVTSAYASSAEGRYLLYRRLMTVDDGAREYIREYLTIKNQRDGLTFRLESKGRTSNHDITFRGVGVFTDNMLWLIGHCMDPFQRLRVMAASMGVWVPVRGKVGQQNFCTAEMLAVKDDFHIRLPKSRTVIIVRDEYDGSRQQADEITKEELLRFVPSEALSLIE